MRSTGSGLRTGGAVVVEGSIQYLPSRYDGVKEIAVKSPKLTLQNSDKSDIRLIAYNSAIAQVCLF